MHPIEHDNVNTVGMPDHSDGGQYDCEGCHARILEMIREAEAPFQRENGKGGWEIVRLSADPNGYPMRWLAEWELRH